MKFCDFKSQYPTVSEVGKQIGLILVEHGVSAAVAAALRASSARCDFKSHVAEVSEICLVRDEQPEQAAVCDTDRPRELATVEFGSSNRGSVSLLDSRLPCRP